MSQKLSPLPPPLSEFLEELRERARRHGWLLCDYTELHKFLTSLYGEAGITPAPTLEPYELDDDS